MTGDRLVAEAVLLQLVDGQLRLGAARVDRVQRWLDGAGFLDAVLPGDVVTLHWDRACERLSPARLHNRVSRTITHIGIANQTLQGGGGAEAPPGGRSRGARAARAGPSVYLGSGPVGDPGHRSRMATLRGGSVTASAWT